MRSTEEERTRRLSRVEMLHIELNNLPDGYQPTEREVEQFATLADKITAVFSPKSLVPDEGQPKKSGKDKA